MCFHCGEPLEASAESARPEQAAAPEPNIQAADTACPHCHSSLPDGLTACFHCGKMLRESAAPTKPPHQVEPTPPPRLVQAQDYDRGVQAGGNKRGFAGIIVAAAVVLLLGGAVGGHFLGLYTLPLLPERSDAGDHSFPALTETSDATQPDTIETPDALLDVSVTPDASADFPDGFHAYTYTGSYATGPSVHVYEGYWRNGLPNGEGTLTTTYPPRENTDPNRSYSLTVILQATFVNGLAHGAVTEIWYMDNGDVHTWSFSTDMGRPRESEASSSTSNAGLTLDPSDIRGVPPWAWEQTPESAPVPESTETAPESEPGATQTPAPPSGFRTGSYANSSVIGEFDWSIIFRTDGTFLFNYSDFHGPLSMSGTYEVYENEWTGNTDIWLRNSNGFEWDLAYEGGAVAFWEASEFPEAYWGTRLRLQ